MRDTAFDDYSGEEKTYLTSWIDSYWSKVSPLNTVALMPADEDCLFDWHLMVSDVKVGHVVYKEETAALVLGVQSFFPVLCCPDGFRSRIKIHLDGKTGGRKRQFQSSLQQKGRPEMSL